MSEKKRNIWIFNHYAGDTYFDNGGRHYFLSYYLKQLGYNPVIFCSNAIHNSNSKVYYDFKGIWYESVSNNIGIPYVFIKGRPYKGNGKNRIINMVEYFFHLFQTSKEYCFLYGKPDIIIGSSVHPLACVAAIILSKRFKCKNIVEIRDLWPESIVEYGFLSSKNIIVKMLYCMEKWIYKKANAIVFTMEGGKDYIVDKLWSVQQGGPINLDKVYYINNGVDLETFEENVKKNNYSDKDLNDSKHFNIVYAGSIRKANNLTLLVDAAKYFADSKVRFLIWGSGDDEIHLKKYIESEKIENVIMKGHVSKKYIPSILKKADAAILNYEKHDIWKYGGSQNKLFEYLAGGTPIITNIRMGYDLIDRYSCGFHIDYDDIDSLQELKKAIVNLTPKDLHELEKNARMAAEEYDYKRLSLRFDALIKKVLL